MFLFGQTSRFVRVTERIAQILVIGDYLGFTINALDYRGSWNLSFCMPMVFTHVQGLSCIDP
jgi:hypothetical protein